MADFLDLFELANGIFEGLLEVFRRHGLEPEPGLKLNRWDGTLAYYDLTDRQIHISVPDVNDPVGKLQLLYLKAMFGCDNNDDLYAFFRLMMPYILAHETAHHFRHKAGLFGQDLWQEEQIANRLAIAVVKPRLTPEDKQVAQRLLPAALTKLEKSLGATNLAADSYHSMLAGLQATGQVSADVMDDIEMLGRLTGTSGDDLLAYTEGLAPDVLERLEQRGEVIDRINAEYTSNYSLYVYYQLGWYYVGLTGRQTEYVEGFARQFLGFATEVLPAIDVDTKPTDAAIRACHHAATQVQAISPVGRSYFYKRYRSSLLSRLKTAELSLPDPEVSRDITLLLDGWKPGGSDPLAYLAHFVVDANLQALFPAAIADAPAPVDGASQLPAETDRRLYQQLTAPGHDPAASTTLEHLRLLESADILRELPAETLVDLARSLIRVPLKAGESIMWQGDVTEDVYLLVEGRLAVGGADPGAPAWAHLSAGEVFGEMAFFTGEPRSANVKAEVDSVCLVLQATDLRLLAMSRPSVLHNMGGALARRLANANNKIAAMSG